VAPCQGCRETHERDEREVELHRRQEIAGIARVHRRYRWTTCEVQGAETWTTFARRMLAVDARGLGVPTIGVARADAQVAKAVRTWHPGCGGMYLWGPPGSGKSLWLSARLTDLMAPTDGSVAYLSEDELMERYKWGREVARRVVQSGGNRFVKPAGRQVVQALVVDEEEVVRRVALAWSADKAPLEKIARVGVLLLDDLGSKLIAGGPKEREIARTSLARLIDLRWREGLPTLVTSNVSPDELGEALDRRTMDRLHEIVGADVHQLDGIPPALVEKGLSWRRPPGDREELEEIRAMETAARPQRQRQEGDKPGQEGLWK
jgi:DNA replication protein DnaC